jgi:enoyl-CoA hydratase/carnithine racemase
MFSAGHDLKEIQSNDPTANRKLFGRCSELMKLLRALPVPVVASVNGLATAAGCQLAAAADLVLSFFLYDLVYLFYKT